MESKARRAAAARIQSLLLKEELELGMYLVQVDEDGANVRPYRTPLGRVYYQLAQSGIPVADIASALGLVPTTVNAMIRHYEKEGA
jgi:hypothetical protein